MNDRVVLDVNVLASAVLFPTRAQGRLVALGLTREFDLVLSEHIVHTLDIVLDRPYFQARILPVRRAGFVSALQAMSISVTPDEAVIGICDDEEDDLVLGTAVAANSDYLVTGDRGLLAVRSYGEVEIVTARELLTVLDAK